MYDKKLEKWKAPIIYVCIALFTAMVLCAACVLASFFPESLLFIVLFAILTLALFFAGTVIIVNHIYKKRYSIGPRGPVLGTIMYDKINC